jgi:DNA-binding GntR family transcriptional regulator
LKDRIAFQIEVAILTGSLKPGDRIVEAKLAKQMGVAQTTVREGIQDLVNQGFLSKRINRETVVRKLCVSDLNDLFRVRVELECLVIELAHSHVREEDLSALYQFVEQMRRAARVKNMFEFFRFDMAFHKHLGSLARNEFLERALVPITVGPVAFVLAGSQFPLEGDYVQVAEDHSDILDAFKEKTPHDARNLLTEKLTGWHQLQLHQLRRLGLDTADDATKEHDTRD